MSFPRRRKSTQQIFVCEGGFLKPAILFAYFLKLQYNKNVRWRSRTQPK
jgi:hypothetical protein